MAGPLGRRQFLEGASGLLICTLAGQKILVDEPADVEALSKQVETPPKVAKADAAAGAGAGAGAAATPRVQGVAGPNSTREYWIAAEPVRWNIVPTGRDQMMDERVKGRTRFTAYAYRAYSRNFGAPIGRASIPGPLLEVKVGETLIVHFRNKLPTPVTMHPHGLFYANDMDGAYKGRFTDPSGFVRTNREFTYRWEAREGMEGAWFYHDHGPMDPVPLFKGLFGPIVVRPSSGERPDREFFLFFHDLQPMATGLRKSFSAVNGRAYAGNTPTLRARSGQEVAIHVYGMDNNFHTFHLHGHRWIDPGTERLIDNKTFGPGDVLSVPFTADNPGRWFYHCHVFSHLHMGMNGWFIVD